MPTPIGAVVQQIKPSQTVLLFGAGASIPSGGPPVSRIIERIATDFALPSEGYSLRELASLAEAKASRSALIRTVRSLCANVSPAGGLENVALYNWKSIFTTNYDRLVEAAFEYREKSIAVYDSDFSFSMEDEPTDGKLYKLHGTIEKDVSDGIQSRIIITDDDYSLTDRYRRAVYDRLRGDLAGANLVIIGHSLADPDIRDVIDRSLSINKEIYNRFRIFLLIFTPDPLRTSLYEARGITVCFGGIDDFFAELANCAPQAKDTAVESTAPYRLPPALEPVTMAVRHALT